jgi:hypothetical protein
MNGIQVLLAGPGHWNHASPSDWAEVLATFPLFSGIPQRRLRKLVRNATIAEYGPGDIVIQKGTSGDSLYLILSEKRVDHMSIGAADAPTTYVKSYDEGRRPT